MNKQETPRKPIGKHIIQTRVLLTWGEMENFQTTEKTRNTIRKLMLHTCILLAWGEKRKIKINYAKTRPQGKPLEHLFCKQGCFSLGKKNEILKQQQQQGKTQQSQTKPLETLISKHVYFSFGEKNEKKNEL